jgi:DNA-binding CsgD family transcriptional regulator/tetratricopeptide (TPR) repeat protein
MQATSASLIGRESELEALGAAFAEAERGSTRVVVVSGEAGIGKTRLVGEFLAGLPENALVLRGQCIDLDRDAPPYAPVVAVLRALVAATGPEAVRLSAGAAGDALAVLLPELGDGAAEQSAASGADRLFDAVATALEAAARESPLVVVVEDLHWADTATLALLRFVVRVLERARVLMLVTYRSDELRRGNPLRSWIPELDRNRRVVRRELLRLSRRQVRQLAWALVGEPLSAADLTVVVQRSDGVPFFVEEILGGGYVDVESIPDTLRDILLARYETLSEPAQRTLRLLAAGGVRVQHELLSAVSGAQAEAIDEAVREAVQARVLDVDDTAYSFRHALVREAVHDELLPGERQRFHTAFARALEDRQGAAGGAASAISYHWMAAHDHPAAFRSSIAAMAEARAAFANSTAARMGERALDLWDQVTDAEQLAGRSRAALLGETAYVLRNAGESDRAIALVDEALARTDPEEEPQEYARLLRDKSSYLANLGQTGSVELLREALSVLEGRERSVLRANVLGELAARLMLDALFADAVRTATAAYDEAVAVGSRARMSVAVNIRGFSRLCLGEIDGGLDDLHSAGELACGDDSAELRHQVNLSDALTLLGRFDEAIRVAETGAEQARSRGVERTSGAILLSNVVAPLFAVGRSEQANEVLDRAIELDPPIGFSAHLQRLKLQATVWAGDAALAERLLRSWRSGLSLQLRIDAQSRLGLAAVSAEIALAARDAAAAWDEIAPVLGPERRSFPPYDLPLLAIAARVIARARATRTDLGGTGDDSARYEEIVRGHLAVAAGWPTSAAYLAIAEAELGGAAGSGGDPDLWRVAVEAAAAATAPAQLLPYTRVRLAEALATVGERQEALAEAESARSDAERIRLDAVVQQVDRLERRVGVVRGGTAARPTTRSAVDGLTEREHQVLGLVAEGRSNRQIAEALFISTKTASVHVSNILKKTGTTSRTEAAFLARSSGA